ncbi:MAG: mannitol dehydrogenase [Lachnospiraceae bacterium]|jgi:mannitol-1-phosphate 5-dehydrogenase|nr:mannitol dehydrogenase [Lachnospiraceae bacterium]
MKAVMYGGGNIGRGFIGMLFSNSGYEVTFVDVAEAVVQELQEKGEYPLRYVTSQGYEDVLIKPVTAVNGNDMDSVARAIAECDIMATAVGVRILKYIVPNLVAGLRRRWAGKKGPLNIIICENLMDANKVLERMLKEQLTEEECQIFDEQVGLVEASIGRMVPVQTDEMKDGEPLRVCVEQYGFLPVDQSAFKGEVPHIKNMIPFEPFDFFIKRKLYIHNMGHATCAYLGDILGLNYICQAIDQNEIYIIVRNAMEESAMALSAKYDVPLEDIMKHISDLLYRFTNAALKDTCKRVGGDPGRKLSPQDRLIGSANLALHQGIIPAYIAIGAAAAVHRYIEEADGMEQGIEQAESVLADVCELERDGELAKLILNMYQMILEKKSLGELRRTADTIKAASLENVV